MKDFHLSDILSITTGRLVSTRHMDGIYDILGYMSGQDLTTIALTVYANPAKESLLKQYPFLEEVDEDSILPFLEGVDTKDREAFNRVAGKWMAPYIEKYGEYLAVDTIK